TTVTLSRTSRVLCAAAGTAGDTNAANVRQTRTRTVPKSRLTRPPGISSLLTRPPWSSIRRQFLTIGLNLIAVAASKQLSGENDEWRLTRNTTPTDGLSTTTSRVLESLKSSSATTGSLLPRVDRLPTLRLTASGPDFSSGPWPLCAGGFWTLAA